MVHLVVLLALLPAAGPIDASQDLPGAPAIEIADLYPPPEVPEPLTDDARLVLSVVTEGFRPEVANQVRIEQRITIRIAPRAGPPPAPLRPFMMDQRDRLRPERSRISERHAGKCLPISGIAGVQVGRDNRLMAFLRDRRVMSLGLEKGCRAQDFYSGFYVERSSDGQLCIDRDRLQSRSGANCALTRLRQLVEE